MMKVLLTAKEFASQLRYKQSTLTRLQAFFTVMWKVKEIAYLLLY